MITKKQHQEIARFLKRAGITTQEFYEELYDHICTSYESRINKSETIEDHIDQVVEPSFGGIKGLLKIKERRTKLRVAQMRKRFWQILRGLLFSWPTILISMLVVLSDFIIFNQFGGKSLLIFTLITFGIIPVLLFYVRQLHFYWLAKRARKGFTSSEKFTVFAPFLLLLVSIPNIVIQFSKMLLSDDDRNAFFMNAYLTIPLSIFITIVFIASFKLFQEEFKINLRMA